MIQKLEELKLRFEEVGQLIVQPDIIQDMKKYTQLNKEYRDLEKIVTKYDLYRDALNHQQQAKELLEKEKDPDRSVNLSGSFPHLKLLIKVFFILMVFNYGELNSQLINIF